MERSVDFMGDQIKQTVISQNPVLTVQECRKVPDLARRARPGTFLYFTKRIMICYGKLCRFYQWLDETNYAILECAYRKSMMSICLTANLT